MSFNLNNWLGRWPKPSAVIVEREGQEKARVEVAKGGRWKKALALTLEGLAPYTRLSLVDGQGSVITAKAFDEDADEPEEKSKAIASDESELVVFARLLTEATKDQPILAHAMTFIAQQAASLAASNTECERLRADNNRLRLQIGQLQLTPTEDGQTDSGVMGVLAQIATGMQAGAAMRPAQGLKRVPTAAPAKVGEK
jgi:hypothetical protein